jgi:membrane fusion protein, adhesin transport system
MSEDNNEDNRFLNLSWGARSFIAAPSSAVLFASVLLIFFSLVFFTIASFFIEIDLVVKSRGQTNSLLGIKDSVAQISGQIEILKVKDGDVVEEGQVIGQIRIEGTKEAQLISMIQELKNQVDLCHTNPCVEERFSINALGIMDPSIREQIADVNRKFSSYFYTHSELKTKILTELDPLKERQRLILGKLQYLKSSDMKKYLVMQKESLEEESGRITQQVTNLQNQIEERIHQSKNEAIHSLRLAIFSLESFILKHQIRSPVRGRVSRLNRTQGSFVALHEIILTIVPEHSPIITEALVDTKDIGKVSRGNKVIISVDAFPPHRYGYFSGKVIGIEHIRGSETKPDHYLAKIKFDEYSAKQRSLASQTKLVFSPGMQTQIRIISRRETVSSIILDKLLGTGE